MRNATTVLLALIVAGCSNSGGGGGTTSSNRCRVAPAALVSAISSGLTITGGGSLRNAKAVKSTAFEKVWFVSANLEGSGLEGADDIATWATNDLAGAGSIFAVDAVANEFSEWADGRTTDARFSLSGDGVQASRDCATG
jgi:hypothetical protein